MLADEQALHLLPPLRLLPGPAAAYLDPPASSTSGSGTFGRACFGAVPGGSGGRRQDFELYVKLLGGHPLERCLAAAGNGSSGDSSSEGNGGCLADCSAAVPLVLHRLACACFPDTLSGGAELGPQLEQHQRQALLCSVLQRCGSDSSSCELQQLLGMLLRWDATAGQPSDAISRARLQAVEAACSAVGLDSAAVLEAALEA